MKRTRLAQQLTNELKENLVYRVEPYLKAGLSVRNACLMSGVPRSTLYKIMEEDDYLKERIDHFRIYLNVVAVTSVSRQLYKIIQKQQAGRELTTEDIDFLKWFALNSRQCRDEFGRSAIEKHIHDPEVEISKLTRLIDKSCDQNEYDSTS